MASNDGNNETASLFFEQDDEETLNLLVSASKPTSTDMASRLSSLASRFQQDADASYDDYWKGLIQSTRGFSITHDSPLLSSTSTSSTTNANETPSAFQSEAGQDHVRATAALLRISPQRAVQLTLSTIRAVTSDVRDKKASPHFQSLLGTRALLQSVVKYHYTQRVARLQVVAECLRMEQDESSRDRSAIVEMLDGLDGSTVMGGRKRGLFRRLLTVACKPDSLPTQEELLPSLKLRDKSSSHLSASQGGESDSSRGDSVSWRSFVAECMEASRRQIHRERVEAMEALLVLLYDHIHEGVHRVDYAMLLTTFQSCNTFFTDCSDRERLCQLAGLVCAECMGLWRVFSDTDSTEGTGLPTWVMGHPMLSGVVRTPGTPGPTEAENEAEQELEALRNLLLKFSSQVLDRRRRRLLDSTGMVMSDADDYVVEAPEALALLTFGLLLRHAYKAILESQAGSDTDVFWREFENYGMDCTTKANDEGGAYAYLHAVMESMVTAPPVPKSNDDDSEELDYDWLLSNLAEPEALESGDGVEAGSATVAYASIGREVLISTISAFRATILSKNHDGFCANVGMLCSLAAVIYQNQPVLCEQFWDSFTTTSTSNNALTVSHDDPMCYLLDSANYLSVSALNSTVDIEQQPGLEEALLPALEPLLRLLSSLCSSSQMVQSVVGILPDGMIRTALLFCSPTAELSDGAAFFKYARSTLDSVATLDRVGNSRECRLAIRRALEVAGSNQPDGPRVLFRIVSNSNQIELKTGALQILADLFESAGDDPLWALAAGRFFGFESLSSENEQATHASVQVIKGFVNQLTVVAFSPLCRERDVSQYLQTVMQGTLAASNLLSSMRSTTGNQSMSTASPFPYQIAKDILNLMGTLLMSLRPIAHLHGSSLIRSESLRVRNTVISNLATSTSLGESISFIATAPVSLSLAAALNKRLEEAQVLSLASIENDADNMISKYGAWHTVMQGQDNSRSQEDVPHLVGEYVEDLMANIHKLDIDLEAVQSLGWIGDDEESFLQASRAALDLILVWAKHAEDMFVESNGGPDNNPLGGDSRSKLLGGGTGDLLAFSPYRLLSTLAVVPPPVQDSRALSSIWPREKISTAFFMVRFLPGGTNSSVSPKKSIKVAASAAIETLTMCVTHSKLATANPAVGNPSLSMVLGSCQHLQQIFHQLLKTSLQLTSSDSSAAFSTAEKEQIQQSFLILQMLCACVEAQPHLAQSLLVNEDNKPSILMDLLIEASCQAAIFMQQSDYTAQLSGDMRLLCQLRIASGCLNTLAAIWKIAHTPERNGMNEGSSKLVSAVNHVITDSTMLSDLVTLVTKHSSVTHANASDDENDLVAPELHTRAVLMEFVAMSLGIVSVEMVAALKKSQVSDTDSPWRLLKREMENDLALKSMSKSFTVFDSPQQLSTYWGTLLKSSTCMAGRQPTELLRSFPAVMFDQLGSRSWVYDNVCNVPVASEFITKHYVADSDTSGVVSGAHCCIDNIASVQASYVLLCRELNLIAAWKRFAQGLILKEARIPRTEGLNRIEDTASACLSISRETLESLLRNVTNAELSQLDMPGEFLSSEAGTMACALGDLLLGSLNQYVELRDSTASASQAIPVDLLTEMLGQLNESCEKMFSILCQTVPLSDVPLALQPKVSTGGVEAGVFKTFCILQQTLLASAIILVTTSETDRNASSQSREAQKRMNEYCVGFVGIACRTVTLIEPYAFSTGVDGSLEENASKLLGTCVALMTRLVSRGAKCGTSEVVAGTYLLSVAASIRKYDAIKTLVKQANTASALAAPMISGFSPENRGGFEESQQPDGRVSSSQQEMAVDAVQSIFMFLSAVADVGNGSLETLSLLSAAGVSQLILRNPLFLHAGELWCLANAGARKDSGGAVAQNVRRIRGYVLTERKSGFEKRRGATAEVSGGRFFQGRDDPVHEIWRTAIHAVATMVRSSRQSLGHGTSERMNALFVQTAVDFLRTYHATLLSCLKVVCAVPFGENRDSVFPSVATAKSDGPNSVTFTLNLLREARDVLSLVSELCTPPNRNHFERASQSLYEVFVQASLEITKSLGQFLGAAGAAREWLTALAAVDSDDPNTPGDIYPDSSSDLYPLIEGGMPNARHEAFRNANYAIRCCALVTADDYDASDMSASSSSSHLADFDFGHTFQIDINSQFILRMEQTGAECLCDAISVIWKTHPAASAFVSFTAEEASRLDSMSLVKKGMIVALLKSTEGETLGFSLGSNDTPSSGTMLNRDPNILFARIEGMDTIRRQLRVRHLETPHAEGASFAESVVSADLLTGIEDMSKRKCLFDYYFAESASAIESSGGSKRSESLGHLILALRWCYQYNSMPGSHSALIRCLTERVSVLLALELSLHNEIGISNETKAEVTKRLDAQLFDLFGDVGRQSHVPTPNQRLMAPAPLDMHREGRLKKIIQQATWATLQQQLKPDLERARKEVEELRRKTEQSAFGNASPSYRRNTFFRGISY